MAWLVVWASGCRSQLPVDPVSRMVDASGDRADQLRTEVRTWEGTPHRLGGNDRQGIDCSGLVVQLYRDLFDTHLPRTTLALSKTGQPVDAGQFLPADLVFFRLPDGKRHVGIYLDGGQFAHASTRRGVMISRLQEPYWQATFWTARRLLR
jgi:probable lipoprotein NlpC